MTTPVTDFNFTSNGNFEETPYPDFTQISAVCITFIVAYFIVMLLALVGNAMVFYVVVSNRKMHTVVNYYIVNLSICDFMVGGFVLPVKLLELTAPANWGAMNDNLCTAMSYLQTIFVFASVLTLVATCLERYSAIVHPLHHRKLQSKARAKKILLIVWCIPCVVASPFLYPSLADSNVLSSSYGTITRLTCFITLEPKFRQGYYTFLFIFIYLLPLIFIGGTCYQIARCLLKEIAFHRQGSLRRQEAYRRKVAKMVIIVVIAFAISWTPYFLVAIITQYQPVNFLERENFFFTMLCINLFAFLNSCVNPFIYAAMSSRFRSGFRRILMSTCCRVSVKSFPCNNRTSKRLGCSHHIIISCDNTNATSSDSGSHSDSLQQTALPAETTRKIKHFFNLVSRNKNDRKINKSIRKIEENYFEFSLKILSKSSLNVESNGIIPRSKSFHDSSSPSNSFLNKNVKSKRLPSLPDLSASSLHETSYL
ncbi:QRFP-like peptide receptor [Centruroides sculpturatus]|uniref:QRFP-like peptide receptor n=1 Tax=Centruroides sculpturatus TaxID=218467 RepID=UPI000C6E71DC|nr:QRFP-like peptide receptor [Centruroides sculpturatus]